MPVKEYPPRPANEEERLVALYRYALLDTPPESPFDRLTSLAARLFGVPIALVTLVDQDRQWFKACQGPGSAVLGISETPRDIAFCAYTILSAEPFVVEDALLDPRFVNNPLVTGALGLRFYAGAPLIDGEGRSLGALCLLDFQPRAFSAEQRAALTDLAASVVSEMELRRASATLAESERLYRQMFEGSPQSMWIFDIGTLRFLAVNETAIAHYGYTRPEILAMTLADFHPSEDVPALYEARPGFGLQPGEKSLWRHRKKDGTLIWVEIAAHTIEYEGRAARMVVANDVTERKQAEEASHRSLTMMKAQQEAAPDGILVVDEHQRIRSYNQRLCELWAVPDEIRRSDKDARMLGHALSLVKNPDSFLQRVQYLYEHPSEQSHEEIELADGRTFERYSGPMSSEEGHYYGRVWFFRDITERRRMEQALHHTERKRALHIQQTPLAAIEWGLDFEVTAWNPAAEEIFGYTQAEALGRRGPDLILPDSAKSTVDAVRVALLSGTGGTRSTNLNRTKDGRKILCEWYNTPLVDDDGKVIGVAALAQDVTEKAHAEAALRESERRFREIAETIQEVFWVSSPDWSFVEYVSPAYERLWGRPCAELYARPDAFLEAIHPDDRTRVLEDRKKGYPLDHEYRVIQPSGEVRWVQTRVFPVRSPRGVTLRLVGVSEDVTERKQAEAQLRESEGKYRLLAEGMEDVISLHDSEGNLLYVSPSVFKLTGYTPEEALAAETLSEIHPDDRAKLRAGGEPRNGHGTLFEVRRWRKDGGYVWVEVQGSPLPAAPGRSAGFVSVMRDISGRKQAEVLLQESRQRYKSLVDYHPHTVCSIDTQGNFLSVNAAFEHLTGYTEAEAVGQPFAPLVAPESLAQSRRHYEQTLQGHPQRHDLTLQHKTGRRIEARLTTVPIVVDGAVIGIYAVVEDITERNALESEREELLTQTEVLLADALERADHDPLTGLINHRAFHKHLEEQAEAARREGSPLSLLLLDLNDFKFFNDAYGHLAGDDVLRRVAQALRAVCRAGDTLARFGGDEFALLLPGAGPEEAARAADLLRQSVARVGYRPPGHDAPIPLRLSIGVACAPTAGAGRVALLAAADARLRIAQSGGDDEGQAMRLRRGLTRSIEGFTMLDALVTAVDNKDRYTRRHSEDVMAYGIRIARALGMDAQAQHTIKVAALLHDVGKIGVPDQILRKPGRLTEEEFAAVKQHPLMGSVIVGAVPGFEETLDAVRHHHERWDGEGYPFGLRGAEIPLTARLMAVADAYSAMTTDRPYRKGMDPEKARRLLEEGAGTQWDPACVAAFLGAEG